MNIKRKSKIVEIETEDITGPEMIQLLIELIMYGKKSDQALIQNIKETLINWKNNQ